MQVAAGTAGPVIVDERLRALESQYDWLRHRVGGWAAWPVLRFRAQWHAGFALDGGTPPARGALARQAIRDLPALVTPRAAPLLVKTFVSGLVERTGAGWRDVWFDDVLDVIGVPAFKIDALNSAPFLSRRADAARPADASTAAIDLTSAVCSRLPVPADAARAAAAIGPVLAREFPGASLDDVWAAKELARFVWQKRAYGFLLERVAPSLVLVADPTEYPLTAAARERGILVHELQHGLIDQHHSAYSWTDYARPYRDSMPVPHRIFVFGEFWRDELAAGGFWDSELVVTGSPRMDAYRAAPPPGASGATPPRIVVTTQGMNRESLIEYLQAFLRDAADVVMSVRIKLHPIYDPSPAPYRAALGDDARVEVISGSEAPTTFQLLRDADLHVSVSSTCHYDALGLGAATAIVPLPSHEVLEPLWIRGDAVLLSGPASLAAAVRAGAYRQPDARTRARYFAPGAVDNIRREVQDALDAAPRQRVA